MQIPKRCKFSAQWNSNWLKIERLRPPHYITSSYSIIYGIKLHLKLMILSRNRFAIFIQTNETDRISLWVTSKLNISTTKKKSVRVTDFSCWLSYQQYQRSVPVEQNHHTTHTKYKQQQKTGWPFRIHYWLLVVWLLLLLLFMSFASIRICNILLLEKYKHSKKYRKITNVLSYILRMNRL